MRKVLAFGGVLISAILLAAGAAGACGGLVAPNGTVRLLGTSTLAAYVDGIEHYVTSFQFAGGGAEVGSIVPLPGVPTLVERGGDWTLQRLARETQPEALASADEASGRFAAASAPAEVLIETRIDALDITVLRGGGTAVGDWARENGFQLSPDAPAVLDFYAEKSPVFMAARFDATAARASGQGIGDGTPIHLTIPTERPWVPIRILGLGRGALETVEADVYLLTEDEPELIVGKGLDVERSERASDSLLSDLRSDKGMEWMPEDMWLSYVRVDAQGRDLDHDLAIAPRGEKPSLFDFDRTVAASADANPQKPADGGSDAPAQGTSSKGAWIAVLVVATLVVVGGGTLAARSGRS